MAELPHRAPLLGLYSGAIVHGNLSYNVKCYNAWGKLNVSNPPHNHQFHHGDLTSFYEAFLYLCHFRHISHGGATVLCQCPPLMPEDMRVVGQYINFRCITVLTIYLTTELHGLQKCIAISLWCSKLAIYWLFIGTYRQIILTQGVYSYIAIS